MNQAVGFPALMDKGETKHQMDTSDMVLVNCNEFYSKVLEMYNKRQKSNNSAWNKCRIIDYLFRQKDSSSVDNYDW